MQGFTQRRIAVGVALLLLCITWGFICGAAAMDRALKKEAMQAGAGAYVLDLGGELVWKWKRN